MKSLILKTAAIAFAAATFNAFAANVPLPIFPAGANLTPGTDSGSYSLQTCPPAGGCVDGASGTATLGFNIVTFNGTMNIVLSGTLEPDVGYYSFVITVKNPASTPIASNSGNTVVLVSSFSTPIGGTYSIEVDWTLHLTNPAIEPQTASWSVTANTARAQQVPEPATLALVAIALLGIGALRLRRNS
ncbi:MAG TPA: PEP-CTERM sorting domain-containing protein [Casimicrobiaceae bacterium]|nr:PEP-CTERM sorting domain-containing protein [Casimicrobiaceae bacterium]